MVLREAFRHQNFLNGLAIEAQLFLTDKNNITKRESLHLRKAVNPEAEDEVEESVRDTKFSANDVIEFLVSVIDEKNMLSNAIENTKAGLDINIDPAIAINKVMQSVCSTFGRMSLQKESEQKRIGTATKFNINGEQVQYRYDINEKITLDFDRDRVKYLQKKLLAESDKVSAAIDVANVTAEVKYEPVFDISDSFEECVLKFILEE